MIVSYLAMVVMYVYTADPKGTWRLSLNSVGNLLWDIVMWQGMLMWIRHC